MTEPFPPSEPPARHTPATFDPDEYAARLAAVQARMAERALDAIVVSDPANLFYLCGYNAWSFYVPAVPGGARRGRRRTCSRGRWTRRAPTGPRPSPRDRVHGYPERAGAPPDRAPVRLDRPARGRGRRARRPARRAGRRRARRPLLLRPRLPRAGSRRCRATPRSSTAPSWSTGCGWSSRPPRSRQLRIAGRSPSDVMRSRIDGVRAGRRQCEVVAEIQRGAGPRHGGARRRLPGDRADAAHRRVGRHAPPDVDATRPCCAARPPPSSSPASTAATTRRWPGPSCSAARRRC